MASADFKRLIARAVALGARTSDLARQHGYTDRGMRKLIASADVQRFLTFERARQEELADEYRARLVLAGAQATETVERVVEDPDHPRNVDTCRRGRALVFSTQPSSCPCAGWRRALAESASEHVLYWGGDGSFTSLRLSPAEA